MTKELINHPEHYEGASLTARSALVHLVPEQYFNQRCVDVADKMNMHRWYFSAVKYLWRCGEKDGVSAIQDLQKSRWYLVRLTEQQQLCGQGRHVTKAIAEIDRLIEELR